MSGLVRIRLIVFALACLSTAYVLGARPATPVKRVGMVVGIKPDQVAEYKRLHSGDACPVRDLLAKYHIHNFSIYLREIGGKWYEFGYYEYRGSDYEKDMAALAAEPRNIEWLKVCDAMQLPLEGEKTWGVMEEVFHNP